MRTVVGYHRYDTAAELLLLNKIWQLAVLLTNYFYPQQKLISKVRDGAKVIQETRHRHHPVHRRARITRRVATEEQTSCADRPTPRSIPPPSNARSKP